MFFVPDPVQSPLHTIFPLILKRILWIVYLCILAFNRYGKVKGFVVF